MIKTGLKSVIKRKIRDEANLFHIDLHQRQKALCGIYFQIDY